MSKRKFLYSGHIGRKRSRECIRSATNLLGGDIQEAGISPSDLPNDTSAALSYLRSIFPTQKLLSALPPIILKHQLYSLVKSKTDADRDLNKLRDNGEVLFFKLASGMDEYGIVYTSDYRTHLSTFFTSDEHKEMALKFVDNVLVHLKDVSLDKKLATSNYGLSDEDITGLMNAGILLRRDVGSWWISIPGNAVFMKYLTKGRKAILRLIKLRRYKEIPQCELESRSLAIHSKLGTLYHLHDILGAELVVKVMTTTGILIRYIDLSKQTKRKKQLVR